jgi:hypothetical protein
LQTLELPAGGPQFHFLLFSELRSSGPQFLFLLVLDRCPFGKILYALVFLTAGGPPAVPFLLKITVSRKKHFFIVLSVIQNTNLEYL